MEISNGGCSLRSTAAICFFCPLNRCSTISPSSLARDSSSQLPEAVLPHRHQTMSGKQQDQHLLGLKQASRRHPWSISRIFHGLCRLEAHYHPHYGMALHRLRNRGPVPSISSRNSLPAHWTGHSFHGTSLGKAAPRSGAHTFPQIGQAHPGGVCEGRFHSRVGKQGNRDRVVTKLERRCYLLSAAELLAVTHAAFRPKQSAPLP